MSKDGNNCRSISIQYLRVIRIHSVVTKPVVGILDLANNVSQGIRNTTTIFDVNDIDRLRLPRYIASDGILRVRRLKSLADLMDTCFI